MTKLVDRLAEKFKLASKILNSEFMLIDLQGFGKIYNFARNDAKTSVDNLISFLTNCTKAVQIFAVMELAIQSIFSFS